ncbi:MAG: hypothetical protein ABJB01_03810 [Rudaea sp.]
MMRYLKFVLPILAVVVIDLLFQFGIWEAFASPNSHAGMSITKKRALRDATYAHIDYVTLGSSRPVYGMDHEALSAAAAQSGRVQANLTVAGMHWMSLGVFTHWLHDVHPEIRGGIIAFAVQDFLAPGNGSYEIGIAYPFRRTSDIGEMKQHVPFDWHDPSTYGLYSGLFEYHEDVQDFVAAPRARHALLSYFRSLTPTQVLAGNASETKDICSAKIQSLSDCESLASRTHDAVLDTQCRLIRDTAVGRYDLRPFLADQPLTPQLQQTRDLIRTQLSSMTWAEPPIVVLMPMPALWLRDALPEGAHDWALSILKPLIAEGRIRVVDYTDLFNADGVTDCSAFFDLYHNNVSGRDRLMQNLLPYLQEHLY